MRNGFKVRACLTDGAAQFVTPTLFEALTGQPCLDGVFEEPERGRMAHIEWARSADVLLVAPATANVINKLANGYADDMLTTIALAYEGRLVVAPAMNPSMYAHDTTQRSLGVLRARAAVVVEPSEGTVACGEQGQGKLASNEQIVSAVLSVAQFGRALAGKKVVITSGPTEEPIDDVRAITNRSSGKMGSAVARAALMMGAEVTVIAGPQRATLPLRANIVNVRTALEMHAAALVHAKSADVFIGVAAVGDFRPEKKIEGKSRSGSLKEIKLVANPDIVADVAQLGTCQTIAFSAEPDANLAAATEKMRKKGVHAIAVNDVSRSDTGFESDDNELTLLFSDGRRLQSGKASKLNCAVWLLEQTCDK